jgi:hypothetical protein
VKGGGGEGGGACSVQGDSRLGKEFEGAIDGDLQTLDLLIPPWQASVFFTSVSSARGY